MKKVFFSLLMLPAFITMMSCASTSKTSIAQLNGKWDIVEVKGNKITKEKKPYIEFNVADNKVHGNGGCNMFNTVMIPNEKDVSAFNLRAAASTMMACPDMELEGVIMISLESITGVKAGNGASELQLIDKDGKTLFVLSK